MFTSLGASVVSLLVFVGQQRRRAVTTGSPLVELDLFHRRSFAGGMLIALLFMAGISGFFVVLTVYLQTGHGYSVLRPGLTTIPGAATA